MNIWQKVVNFINDKDINDIFTRKDMFYYTNAEILRIETTVDRYKGGLIELGVIKTIKRGKYVKISDIPGYINSGNFKNPEMIKKLEMKNKFKLL